MNRLLSLYPRAWRERYAEEFVALLDEIKPSPSLYLDVLIGALVAHVDQFVQRPTGRGWRGWTLTRRGESMTRLLLATLALGTTAVTAFATIHELWLDSDPSASRPLAAVSFAVPVVIGVATLLALLLVTPRSRPTVARAMTSVGALLAVIGVVGGLNALVIGLRTGDYEGWVATIDAALSLQGVLTVLYFSSRVRGDDLVTS